ALSELLARAGVPAGERLRGPALATYVVVEAADGYRAVFSQAELDPALGGRRVLVADARDGRPLGGAEGPLRLVSPDDRRHSRWVRQIVRITVRRG
ncbi:MAG: molybdopterin-binding protein, partial [Gemmatimonadetes bacterium]|nr:molybdopterin-binding protein [Gemmatimonadota bacterium]